MITDDISPLGGYAGLWLDRRVKIGYETAEELAKHYNPLNFRGHPENQRDATEESLDALGYVGQVKKSLHSGVILDGHLRIEIALAKDPAIQLPVDYYDLTPDEELLALQVLDTTTEMAQPIADKLAALMERTKHLTADKPGLAAMLAELRVRAGVNGHQPTRDVEPQIDKAAQLAEQWGTRIGQVWELGQHRLACGDCTDRVIVEAVMRGGGVDIQIQDPPYGIDLGTDYSYLNNINSSTRYKYPEGTGGNYQKIANDDKPFEFDRFNVIETKEAFWWGANYYHFQLPIGGSWLVWDKQTNENAGEVLDSIGSSFELCWSKIQHRQEIIRKLWRGYFGTETQDTKSRLHPTQKPVEVISWILEKYSKPDDVVADFFLGSGTTLIACENLNRRCRAIELDPGYCAVTLQRWADLTGQQPRLISG